MRKAIRKKPAKDFTAIVGRALRRAAKAARKIARMHGTPIYIWRDGKIIALKPKKFVEAVLTQTISHLSDEWRKRVGMRHAATTA